VSFIQLGQEKRDNANSTKKFFFLGERKRAKNAIFQGGEKQSEIATFIYVKFQQHAAKTLAGMLKLFKMSTLTSSQIWLSLLVDDCQSTYLTKLGNF